MKLNFSSPVAAVEFSKFAGLLSAALPQHHLLGFEIVQFSSVTQSCPTLCDPMDWGACQAPLSMGFSKKEYWNVFPFPSPGNRPDPGIKPRSPALQADFLLAALRGKSFFPVKVVIRC